MGSPLRNNPDHGIGMKQVDAITKKSSPDVLNFLSMRGPGGATANDIVEGLGNVMKPRLMEILRDLESLGLVTGTPGPELRPKTGGRPEVIWRINRRAVRDTAERFVKYVTATPRRKKSDVDENLDQTSEEA